MTQRLEIQTFIEKQREGKLSVVDVRSPSEFQKGHFPTAINIPLFENDERAVVGTLYKQEGKEEAFLRGLEFVGPKMRSFVEQVRDISRQGTLMTYCWRGGMRSSSMAWLWETAGFNVFTLEGGYKAFRKEVLASMSRKFQLMVLGGPTGSGKTEILKEMKEAGEQVIDLEGLARHKGSAFGGIGENTQPSTEHFENLLWSELIQMDAQKPIWLEDESIHIGKVLIPKVFFDQMQSASLFVIDLEEEERLKHLVDVYAGFEDELLIDAINRIGKRLGGQHAKAAEEAIRQQDYRTAAKICLKYYDKTYAYGLTQKSKQLVSKLGLIKHDPKNSARKLIDLAYQRQPQ
ncbi:MAG: tRNA 2-selenouridine(34) synthase MnmH [Bacteroidia bacterium]|nr:tRNA 2-selenouridine(34) synthase MnmH [Bacteroidia bacterium]